MVDPVKQDERGTARARPTFGERGVNALHLVTVQREDPCQMAERELGLLLGHADRLQEEHDRAAHRAQYLRDHPPRGCPNQQGERRVTCERNQRAFWEMGIRRAQDRAQTTLDERARVLARVPAAREHLRRVCPHSIFADSSAPILLNPAATVRMPPPRPANPSLRSGANPAQSKGQTR